MTDIPRPLPPSPVSDRNCTYGVHASAGWCWFTGLRQWERICMRHVPAAALRRGLYVPDTATTPRRST
ncbi:hypothetical protein [Nonomuraea ceibae]|uniref:hypothetical protein n=1 Tax=Nonomuraea ceibae TaxID=1935170 RepID=UPI001C5DC064|nr:hypothetical protein [Nonomuraea ceibae]